MTDFKRSPTVRVSAWTRGAPMPPAELDPDRIVPWALHNEPVEAKHRDGRTLDPGARVDLTQPQSPAVGWGVVLPPARGGLLPSLPGFGASDFPPAIRRLVDERLGSFTGGVSARRAAPVFRFVPGPDECTFLRTGDGKRDLDIQGSPIGLGDDAIPFYLLLCGSPQELPWRLQYILGRRRCVGRLDLPSPALDRYVDHLLSDWRGEGASRRKVTVWSVVHDDADVTRTMRDAIAVELAERAGGDRDVDLGFIDGTRQPATWAALGEQLEHQRPGIVVTTSHGCTDPTDGTEALAQQLGLPVDQGGNIGAVDQLLARWEPNGAVWYSHACCSAGCDAPSIFENLFGAETEIGRMLRSVAACGPRVAPLATALLSAPKPLRAFVGHVEPTFDYTLAQPLTGQSLTTNLCAAVYPHMVRPEPVGHAFLDWQAEGSALAAQYTIAQGRFDRGEESEGALLYYGLRSADIQSLVILGDPAAILPPPVNNAG